MKHLTAMVTIFLLLLLLLSPSSEAFEQHNETSMSQRDSKDNDDEDNPPTSPFIKGRQEKIIKRGIRGFSGEKAVTPYGDFCPQCGHYGTCKNLMSPEDARKAMAQYYYKKGFDVEIENIQGRFIKARVKYREKVVDVIIFDRRTGRIRSIY